ncbi:MAG: ABC transporter ATP-binding protein [Bacteroidota bacterium]
MSKFLLLLKNIVPYWRYALLNVIFNLFSAIFSVFSLTMTIPFLQVLFGKSKMVTSAPPLALSKDAILGNFNYLNTLVIQSYGKVTALFLLCVFVIILFFLKNLTQYMALYFLAPVRTGVVKDLRNNLYNKLLVLPLSYYSDSRRGDLISRASGDIQEIENSIMRSFELMFREPVTIILFLVTLFTLSTKLTVFVLVLLPFAGLIIGLIGRRLRHSSTKSQQTMGLIMANTEETLGGIRILKSYNALGMAADKFREINARYTRLMTGVFRRTDLASPLSEFLGVLILVFVLILGGNMVLNSSNSLSAEGFIGFVLIFSQLINPAKNLSTALYQVQRGAASLARVMEVMEADEKIVESPDAIPIVSFEDTIDFNDVSFSYQSNEVLKHINLSVKKGSVIALVGPSGGGKSTLVDLLPRFYDTSSGSISIDGTDIRDLKIDSLRSLFGIVTQEAILFNDTVFNNIAFGIPNASMAEVEHAARIANAHEFIEKMPSGYFTNIGDRGSRLSGGQRQRLSIARAVFSKPAILIFDEATSALDTESERLVQDALDKLLMNHTSFIVAHRFSTIQKVDLILVLHQGEIVEKGTHRELMQINGLYKKLFDLQSLA